MSSSMPAASQATSTRRRTCHRNVEPVPYSSTRLRSSGYSRDTDGRWFGGVCTGLAQRFGVDPVLIRAAAVVLAFLGGIGLTAYVILWLLLPDRRGDILAERAVRQGDAGPIALLVRRTAPDAPSES